MKKALLIFLAILVTVGVIAACGEMSRPVSAHPGVIRLHILANSDSEEDQAIKLKVRDMVLEKWGKKLTVAGATAEALKELETLLPDIRASIEEKLRELGADYGAALETGEYDFPERDYNGEAFPAGRYKALKVKLGEAAGQNWWCVMFPPLCLVGDGGEMDMEQYMELVRQLDEADAAPGAPVRSWLFDNLFGGEQWDRDFFKWAKEYLMGSD